MLPFANHFLLFLQLGNVELLELERRELIGQRSYLFLLYSWLHFLLKWK
jgi:hypothetical protein